MDLLYTAASIGFFLWAIRLILFWVYLWQYKEYRLDRMQVHLSETTQGRNILFSPASLIPLIFVFAYILFIANPDYVYYYQMAVTVLFDVFGLLVVRDYLQHTIAVPKFTTKALALSVITFIIVAVLYLVPLTEQFFWLLLISRIIALVVAFWVIILAVPTNLYVAWYMDRAMKKISNHKKLVVIGVAGSFGKSSTKEFAAQILKTKFSVTKTHGLKNTALGISQTILSRITPKTNIFIAEMAMYKRGEIAEINHLIHPKIGIITGISSQHASLSGNISKTMEGKFELINFLPKDGLALFNGNNKNAVKLYRQTRKKKVLYYFDFDNSGKKADIVASNAKATESLISFDVAIGNKPKIKLSAPLIGLQNIENILPGIYLADYMGMGREQIKKAVATLSPLPKTMQKVNSTLGATIIDDSFSLNPDAVVAALDYMKIFKGKKILVLQPMIELGKGAKKEHYEIAKKIATVCDYLFLTNRNFYKEITKGVEDSLGSCYVKAASAQEIARYIKEIAGNNDVIVFEGHESELVLQELV